MDYSRIAELKNRQQDKKSKHELNKTEQREYAQEICKAIKEDGLTESTIYYIISMARYGGIDGFIQWYETLQESQQVEAIEKMTSEESLNKLGYNPLRFLLRLLAAIISTKNENSIVNAHILLLLVDFSYKKGGERVAELGATFKNCFVFSLKPYAKLPIFTKYPLPEDYVSELIKMFDEAIDKMPVKKENEINERDRMRKWIAINKQTAGKSNTEKTVLETVTPEENKDIKKNGDTPEEVPVVNAANMEGDANKETKANINAVEIGISGNYAKKLLEIAKVIDLLESDNTQQKREIVSRDKKIQNLTMKLAVAEDNHDKDIYKISELEERIKQNEEQLKILIASNKEMEDRISRQSSVLEVFQEDKINSQSQQLNSVAEELASYYKGYERVKDAKMNSDTEQYLLDLLEDVFKRLKKCGIDVKGSVI